MNTIEKAMSQAERKKKERAKKAESGMVRLGSCCDIWVKKEHIERIKEYIKKLSENIKS